MIYAFSAHRHRLKEEKAAVMEAEPLKWSKLGVEKRCRRVEGGLNLTQDKVAYCEARVV